MKNKKILLFIPLFTLLTSCNLFGNKNDGDNDTPKNFKSFI